MNNENLNTVKSTTTELKWQKVAAGHYKTTETWAFEVIQVSADDWQIYYYGELLTGCGSCTLRAAKRKVESLHRN